MKKLSIIIPAYNESKTIQLILDKIARVELVNEIQKEVIIINDCSTDDTESAINNYIHNNPKLKEPRSPLFIDINNKNSWINENDLDYLRNISGEIEQNLKFHEVNKLSGRFYVGNNPNVLMPVDSQTSLFN